MIKIIFALVTVIMSSSAVEAAVPSALLGRWKAEVSFGDWQVMQLMVIQPSRVSTRTRCSRFGQSGTVTLNLPVSINEREIEFLSGGRDSVRVAGELCNVYQNPGTVTYRLNGNRLQMSDSNRTTVYRRAR